MQQFAPIANPIDCCAKRMVESQKRAESEATRAGDAAAGLHNDGHGHVFDAAHGAGIGGVIKPGPSAGRKCENITAEHSALSDGPSVPLQSKTSQFEGQSSKDKERHSPQHVRYKSKTKHPAGPASNATSAPVLVNPSPFPPDNMPSRSTFRRSTAIKSSWSSAAEPKHALPPLSAFSFSEILASIDSDVSADIHKIAEICGKSKLSMANEYGSHLPPHGARDQIIEQDEDIEEERQALGHETTAHSHWQGVEEDTRESRWELLRRGRIGAGRAVTGTTDITSTATIDLVQRPEPGDGHVVDAIPSPAVRHLQALTRVA